MDYSKNGDEFDVFKFEKNENEPKLKEMTVKHFASRHYWWIEVYRCSEHSESVKQYARIVWASPISSLEVARYDCLPHCFSPTFQPPV